MLLILFYIQHISEKEIFILQKGNFMKQVFFIPTHYYMIFT